MSCDTNHTNQPTSSFSLPLLSIAGQRLVFNVRGLKGRPYSSRSLSAEVDRQIEAFDEAKPSDGGVGARMRARRGLGVDINLGLRRNGMMIGDVELAVVS
ncbi:hypothetical protein BS17DRAFT_780517 [Gyrodon lividus]|nr:hypothetical protein BS17DRAFT_780517 [Gyrodon lividus]